MKLFSEIRRGHVIQGTVTYTIVGWLLIQLAIALEISLELPSYLQHKDFPQFADDIGLVKIWQTFGWPDHIQPKPGTDGSDLQFTLS